MCVRSSTCVPFVAIIQSKWQRDFLKKASKYTSVACMDATGQLNDKRWPLTSIIVPDRAGEAVPVMYMVSSCETHTEIQILLEHFKLTFAPQRIIIDKSDAEMKAVVNVFGKGVPRLCYFHVKQARRAIVRASSLYSLDHRACALLRCDRRGSVG